MANSTTHLDSISASQAQKEAAINGLFDAGSPALTFGRRQTTTDQLVWGYYGGPVNGTNVADGTVTLTASRTNYIVVHLSTFVVSTSTSAANWCTPQTYARLYKVTCGTLTPSSWEDWRFAQLGIWGRLFGTAECARVEYRLPVSADLSTSITTGTDKAYMRAPCAMLLTDVRASLYGESTSGTVTIDINDAGQTILGDKLTIDANEKTSTTAAAAFAFSEGGAVIADDALLTVDIDGAGTSAEGLAITLIGLRGVGDPGRDLIVSSVTMEADPWVDSNTAITWTKTSTPTASSAQAVSSVSASYATTSTLFDGSVERYTSNASSVFDLATAPWAFDLWVYTTSTSSSPHICEIAVSSTMRLSLYLNTGALTVYSQTTAGNGADRITGSAISTGTWYHVRVSYDLTTLRLFQDGAVVGTAATSILPTGNAAVALGNLELGATPGSSYAWPGHMQRWRFTRGWARQTAAFARPLKPWA
ncbi:MAG: hypothetical protein RJA36_3977 [Pseudomonadota bacterium]|jgi:hypothetical protein